MDKLMRFIYVSGPHLDGTNEYDVILNKQYTVRDFIMKILGNEQHGHISVHCPNELLNKCIYEYDNTDLFLKNEIDLNQVVVKCKATKRILRVDYILYLEEGGTNGK